MSSVSVLLKRDVKNSFHKRFFLMLGILLLFQVWFVLTSSAADGVRDSGGMFYMAVVFSLNFLGSIVALAMNSNGLSAERESKMLDLVLTSGVSKQTVFLSKTLSCLVTSCAFAALYTTALTIVYLLITGDIGLSLTVYRYLLPVASFLTVFGLMGLGLSIVLRSSRASLIAALIVGALLMPRLFVLMIDGLSGMMGMSETVTKILYLISPAMIMNALSGYSGTAYALWGLAFLTVYLTALIGTGLGVFTKQDELNYGE